MTDDDLKLGLSYFGVRNPEHVERDLDRMGGAGCNTILHTLSENDLSYYRKTMAEIVGRSKERNWEVYFSPWGVGGIYGGEAFTRFALFHDETRQVLSDGSLAPSACPNNETFREFMREWIDAAAEIGGDVVMWDEPHFFLPEWYSEFYENPEDLWACRCDTCQELFQEEFGYSMPEKINQDVKDFKDERLHNFLKEMMAEAKSKGLKNDLCLLPEWENPEGVEGKWDKYASLDDLDIFGSDPYWLLADKKFEDYEFFTQKVRKLADRHEKEAQVWILAFRVGAGKEEDLGRAIEVAYEEGIRNIMAWSYLGTGYMSSISCDRPEKVWKIIKDSYLELREK